MPRIDSSSDIDGHDLLDTALHSESDRELTPIATDMVSSRLDTPMPDVIPPGEY